MDKIRELLYSEDKECFEAGLQLLRGQYINKLIDDGDVWNYFSTLAKLENHGNTIIVLKEFNIISGTLYYHRNNMRHHIGFNVRTIYFYEEDNRVSI